MASGSTPVPPAGFVGLGTLGAPIAERLMSGGVPLVVHNRDRAKAAPFLSAGATWADSPKELGRQVGSGVVFVMVTDARAVRRVLFGRFGVLAGIRPGGLVVNLSTIAPDESRTLATRLASRGVHYLEAPVAGSVDAARQGELLVFAGGDAADLATARPLLERFARGVEHLGPVGTAAAMKLVNNLVMVATLAADAEALSLAESLGLPGGRVVDLLLAGGGASRALEGKRDAFLRRDYATKFKLSLADKDLGLVARAAREVGARAPIAREAKRLADEAVRAGLGDRDLSAMLEAARARRRPDATTAAPP